MTATDHPPLEFRVDRIRIDGPIRVPFWDLLLRVVGDFCVVSRGEPRWCETDFPIVEFALEASRWLDSGFDERAVFSYDPIEAETTGMIRFTPGARPGWLIHANSELVARRIADASLRAAVRAYLETVATHLHERHGVSWEAFRESEPLLDQSG
jgi:hypothetical protein